MKQQLQLILLGLALCLSTWSWGQTLNETFDGPTIPAGWTTQQVAGTANWTFGSGTMPTGTDFATNAAIIDADANGTTGLDEAYLISPVLNTTTLTNGIELSFDYSLQDFAGDGDLEAEVFDGTNWISIFTISVDQNPTTFPFTNVSAYSNAAFQIRFRFDDDAAGASIWGAGVDNVVLREAPSCIAPSALAFDSATTTTATVSWTSGGSGESAWDIEVGPTGFTPTGTPTDSGVSNPATLIGLTPGTTYDYYVRADCGGGDFSSFTGPFTLTTACVPVSAFNEDFDSVSTPDLPVCWDSFATTPMGTTAAYVETSTLADNTAPNGVRMYSGSLTGNIGSGTSDEGETILVSPELNNLAAGTHRIRFSADAGTSTSTLEVGTMTDPNDPLTFNNLMAIAPTTTHAEYIVDFDTYAGTDVYIAFRHIFAGTFDSMYLDNIVWEAIPACVAPTDLSLVSATDTEVNIAWTNNAGAAASTVIYGAPGFDPTMAGTSIAGGASTATISTLTAETDYDIYVIQDCSGTGNGTSSTVGPLSVTTACAVIAAPYSTDFESFTAATSGFEEDQCWREISATAYDWAIDGSGGTTSSNTGPSGAFSGSTFMFVEASNGNDGDVATVLSPAIDLSTLTDPSVSFYYHMYGAFITDLSVGVSTDGGTSFTTALTITGQQQAASTDAWEQAVIDLATYANQTVIVSFTTSKSTMAGNTFEGDVAIDDVNFDELPSCLGVSNLSLVSNTDTQATINFDSENASVAGDYEYSVNTAATATPAVTGAWTDTGGTTSNVTYTIGTLMPNTQYFIYIREICGAGDESEWSPIPLSFTTDCATFTAPYTEDFESGGATPDCWTLAGDDVWEFNLSGPNHVGNAGTITGSTASGGYYAVVDDSTPDATDAQLNSPFVDVSGLTSPALSFYEISDNEGQANATLTVSVWDGAAWNVVGTYNTNTNGWELKVIDLSGLTFTGPARARFSIADSGSFYDDIAIDDVSFDEAPSCLDVSGVTVDLTSSTSLTVSWTENNVPAATAWEVVAVPTGDPAPTPGTTNTTSNPTTVMALAPDTTYDVYVRTDCATSFTAFVTGTTDCAVVTQYPYVTDFTTNPPNACWDEAGSGEIANGPMTVGSSDWKDGRSYENSLGNQVSSNVINLWQNVDREWLISETYDMTGTSNDVLTVEVAVTDYSFSGASSATDTDTMGSDDQVDLVITTDNGATWTSIFSWNVSNQPSVTGSREIIDLSSYSGSVQFAFFASDGTVDDTEDYDFHVGMFTIDSTAGINDTLENNVSLFPNPANGDVININFDQQPSGLVSLRVLNALGQLVRSEQLEADGGRITLNGISSLTEGMYFLQITNGEQQSTLKFIKN